MRANRAVRRIIVKIIGSAHFQSFSSILLSNSANNYYALVLAGFYAKNIGELIFY